MKSVFELTTAIKPSPDFMSRLRLQLAEKFGKNISLKLQIEPSILGGAIISYQGYYFNFSLKKELEKYFEKNKSLLSFRT